MHSERLKVFKLTFYFSLELGYIKNYYSSFKVVWITLLFKFIYLSFHVFLSNTPEIYPKFSITRMNRLSNKFHRKEYWIFRFCPKSKVHENKDRRNWNAVQRKVRKVRFMTSRCRKVHRWKLSLQNYPESYKNFLK